MKSIYFSFKKRMGLKYPLILVGIFLLVFLPVFFTGFAYDDYPQLVSNKYARNLENPLYFFTHGMGSPSGRDDFHSFYYRPLAFTAHAFLFKATDSPLYFHLFQLIFFLGVVYLVYYFFLKFFISGIAFVLTLIFLVHPINAPLASYIADLFDTFMMFFGLLSFLVLTTKLTSSKKIFLSSLFLLFSLLSKEGGILFAPVLLLYAKLWEKIKVSRYLPFLIASFMVYLGLRSFAFGNYFIHYLPSQAMKEDLLTRVARIPTFIFYYLKEILSPEAAVPRVAEIISDPPSGLILIFVYLLIIAGILGLSFYLRMHSRQMLKNFLLFLFWLFWGMVLYLQLIPLDTFIARYWLSFSLIGALGILGVGISTVYFSHFKARGLLKLLFFVFVVALSIQTLKYNFSLQEWWLNLAKP